MTIIQINEHGAIAVPEQKTEVQNLFKGMAGKECEIRLTEVTENSDHITTIEKIVMWYERLPKGYNDIDTLIDVRKNLSTALYRLSKDVTDAHANFKKLEANRKRGVEKLKKELIETQIKSGDKINVSYAEVTAQNEFCDIRLEENEYEALYKQMQLHYNSTKAILDSFVQHIAHLRGEKSNEMQGKGSN